eukprot:884642-Prymnesium_polylepis.1
MDTTAETKRFLMDMNLMGYDEAMSDAGYTCIFEVKALSAAMRDTFFEDIKMTKSGHVVRFVSGIDRIIMLPRQTYSSQLLPRAALFVVCSDVGLEFYPEEEVAEFALRNRTTAELNALARRTTGSTEMATGTVYVHKEERQLKAVIGADYGKKAKFTSDDAQWLTGTAGTRPFRRPVKTRGQCDRYDMSF